MLLQLMVILEKRKKLRFTESFGNVSHINIIQILFRKSFNIILNLIKSLDLVMTEVIIWMYSF